MSTVACGFYVTMSLSMSRVLLASIVIIHSSTTTTALEALNPRVNYRHAPSWAPHAMVTVDTAAPIDFSWEVDSGNQSFYHVQAALANSFSSSELVVCDTGSVVGSETLCVRACSNMVSERSA